MAQLRHGVDYHLTDADGRVLGVVRMTRREGNWAMGTFASKADFEEWREGFQLAEWADAQGWTARAADFDKRVSARGLALVTADGKERVVSLGVVRIDAGTFRLKHRRRVEEIPAGTCVPCTLARDAYQHGEHEDAVRLGKEAVRTGPDHVTGRMYYAYALVALDRLDEAEATLCEGLAVKAGADLRNALAFVLLRAKKPASARSSAEEGLVLEGTHVGCMQMRARAMVAQGERAGAAAFLEERIAALPAEAALVRELADTVALPEDAVRAFRHYIAMKPEDWKGYHDLGVKMELLDRKADARLCYEIAARLCPPDELLPAGNLAKVAGAVQKEPADAELVALHRRIVLGS